MQDFQTIAHLIPNFGDRVDNPPAPSDQQTAVCSVFADLLGQSARYIQPVLFRSGELIVYAEAAVWGQHIRHRHPTLLDRLQKQGLHVVDIAVKIRPDICASGRKHDIRPASYQAEPASRQLEKLADQLDDEGLQQSLSKLAARIRKNHSEQE